MSAARGLGACLLAAAIVACAPGSDTSRQAEAGVAVAAVNHFISWAIYFDDPDGNGLEIYWDTRHEPGGAALWHGANAPLSAATILATLDADDDAAR